ncbi:hypothetical protein TMatcc_000917, partial [Talaromyces marneffei ATCC 18224]
AQSDKRKLVEFCTTTKLPSFLSSPSLLNIINVPPASADTTCARHSGLRALQVLVFNALILPDTASAVKTKDQ